MTPRLYMGGTFDPVHYGHLRIAEGVREAFGLERLTLIPTAVPPHKPAETMSPIEHRARMLELGLREFPALRSSSAELGTDVCYTYDTLRRLRDAAPQDPPVFVVGMDSVAELPSWHRYRELLDEFDLVAVARPDHPSAAAGLEAEVAARLQPTVLPQQARDLIDRAGLGRGGRIFRLELPRQAVSSREVRRRTAAGDALDDLVPAGEARYIRRHRLYVEGARALNSSTPDDVMLCVDTARDHKAEGVVALDLRGLSDVTDYFVICHGNSDRQVGAIVESIEQRLRREAGRKPAHVEGLRRSDWVLMDYIDFVVHVFLEEKREFYRLERLWGDAPSLVLPAPGDDAGSAAGNG